MSSPRLSTNIFSNEVLELLDYLEEDHRYNVKTFSFSDFEDGELTKKDTLSINDLPKKRITIKLDQEDVEIKLPDIPSSPLNSRKGTFVFTRRSSFDDKTIIVSDPITETKNLKTYTTYLVKYGVRSLDSLIFSDM